MRNMILMYCISCQRVYSLTRGRNECECGQSAAECYDMVRYFGGIVMIPDSEKFKTAILGRMKTIGKVHRCPFIILPKNTTKIQQDESVLYESE